MDEIPVYKKLSMYRTNYIKFYLESKDENTAADKKTVLEGKMKKTDDDFCELLRKYKEDKNNQ
jgi:hypothetical protein